MIDEFEEVMTMARVKLTVEEVKKIAMENYNKGGDVIIECWDDADIQEWIDDKGTKTALKRLFGLYDDKRRDIESTAF